MGGEHSWTYIYTPELLDRLKGDNLLQEIIPVVALVAITLADCAWYGGAGGGQQTNLSA